MRMQLQVIEDILYGGLHGVSHNLKNTVWVESVYECDIVNFLTHKIKYLWQWWLVNTTSLCLTLNNNLMKKPHCLGLWFCNKVTFQYFFETNNFPQVPKKIFTKKMHTLCIANKNVFKKGFTVVSHFLVFGTYWLVPHTT